jgi:hypothetical protein
VAGEFEAAMEAFTTLSRPFWLAVAQFEFADWLMRQERDGEAAGLLIQSRSAFTHLGATPWVERLDATARTTAGTIESRSTA